MSQPDSRRYSSAGDLYRAGQEAKLTTIGAHNIKINLNHINRISKINQNAKINKNSHRKITKTKIITTRIKKHGNPRTYLMMFMKLLCGLLRSLGSPSFFLLSCSFILIMRTLKALSIRSATVVRMLLVYGFLAILKLFKALLSWRHSSTTFQRTSDPLQVPLPMLPYICYPVKPFGYTVQRESQFTPSLDPRIHKQN